MKAVEIGPPGGTESVRLVSRPDPVAGPGQVVVRVEAVSLNYRDLRLLTSPARAFIPTCECAGEVVDVGAEVSAWRIGDRIVNSFYQGWRNGPFRGEYLNTVPGAGIDGALAEFAVFRADSVAAAPAHLTGAQAATIPCAGVTAFNALCGGRGLTADDTVLVLGTGGVSLYALQLATHAGARVIVTSSSDSRLEQAMAMGAHDGVNYTRTPDWAEEVLRASGGHGAEFVVDVVGDIERSVRVLADNGELSLIGTSLGRERTESGMKARDLSVGFTTIRRFIVGPTGMLVDATEMISAGAIVPVIGAEFDFDDASDAFAQLQKGGVFGKIVVHVAR
jgi:NADPH:quinone reductase-like Zn-dependent oxidoreductase